MDPNIHDKVRELIHNGFIDELSSSLCVQKGFTPLFHVSLAGRTDLIQLLLDHRAVVDLPNAVSKYMYLLSLHMCRHVTNYLFMHVPTIT